MDPAELERLLRSAFTPLAPARLDGALGRWTLAPELPHGAAMSIAVDAHWVSLRCVVPEADGPPSLDALATQAGWPGGVKRVGWRSLDLRADVPLLADTAAGRDWFVGQLRAACGGVLGVAGPAEQSVWLAAEAPAVADPELLADACTAAGWNVAVRPDGGVHVDLQVRGVHRTVVLGSRGADVRASVTLAPDTADCADPACRSAAADFLVRASAALRWARAFVGLEDGQPAGIGFECVMVAPHEDRALLLAVDTLISASELFGREVELLLGRPDVATMYARFHGGSGPKTDAAPDVDAAPVAARPARAAPAALV